MGFEDLGDATSEALRENLVSAVDLWPENWVSAMGCFKCSLRTVVVSLPSTKRTGIRAFVF